MASVTDPQVTAFLQAGTRTGKLSYLAADGRPLVAPIWFILEDGCVVFNTGKDTAKGEGAGPRPQGHPVRGPAAAAVRVRAGAGHRRAVGGPRRPAAHRDRDRRALRGPGPGRGDRPAQ